MGWNYAFPNPCEPGIFYGTYPSRVMPDKISTLHLHRKREVNEVMCIEEVGVDLELCVHAHGNDVDRLGSFLQNDYPAIRFFRNSWIDYLQLWFRPCYPYSIYQEEIHSRASSIFDKVKISSIVGQRPSSTTIMFCLRVLPSGISRISCLCTSSY